jgi:pimeloyl-ACP methyl ester carboxylesterase
VAELEGSGREAVAPVFYDDCDPAAGLAASKLWTQFWRPANQTWPLAAFPDAPVTSVVCADDRAVDPAWCRYVAEHWLGVEPIELPGGHSPFLARPGELARLLERLA